MALISIIPLRTMRHTIDAAQGIEEQFEGSTEATHGCIDKACVLVETRYFHLEHVAIVGPLYVRAFGSAFGKHVVLTNDQGNE